jgi:hypothetical protein
VGSVVAAGGAGAKVGAAAGAGVGAVSGADVGAVAGGAGAKTGWRIQHSDANMAAFDTMIMKAVAAIRSESAAPRLRRSAAPPHRR